MIAELCKTASAKLALDLPKDLEAGDRLVILQDFERARAHLISTFTLKLSHWREAPFCIFGIGHYAGRKAMQCFRKAMASNHSHPRLQLLKPNAFEQCRHIFESCEGSVKYCW